MVAEAGQADEIIPLDIMAYEIVRRTKNSRCLMSAEMGQGGTAS
jgi:hypothetical protein